MKTRIAIVLLSVCLASSCAPDASPDANCSGLGCSNLGCSNLGCTNTNFRAQAGCELAGHQWGLLSTEQACTEVGHQWGLLSTEQACTEAGHQWGPLLTKPDCVQAGHVWTEPARTGGGTTTFEAASNDTSPTTDAEPEAGGDDSQDIASPEGRVDLTWTVDVDGPYQAGHRTVEVTYETLSTGQNRTVLLHLWYPTEATSGDDVAYVGLFSDESVYGNAPLASPAVGDTYPVHVHSHGDLGYAGSSPYLMRHFATHGWVVAAPDHTGNTIVDNISPRPTWMYTVRLEDISATLDHLQQLPDEDPLAGKLDPSQAVLSGHSYGAYTTLGLAGADYDLEHVASICAEEQAGECTPEVLALFEAGLFESRIVAAIPMAPGNHTMYGDEGVAAVEVPTLHMTGSEDRPDANENIWNALPSPAVRVHVAGGCHQLFALGGCELIDDDTGLPIVNAYALAFARHHLLDDEGVMGLLDGSELLDEAVTLSVK